ncbi:choline transporter-like protein 4 [Anneissia japonica]|uniref:choline transporter-like protein 4 n=1 Tax=Anneissia japonica TaxID=1529436 RepID=UPI0014256B78|nr:choline transporter-like protein 4 [Anneissia japonica]
MGKRRNSDASDDEPKEKVKYYGEPKKYDPTFDGPISNRSCTDIICCFVFVLFLAGLGVISAIGFQRGNVETLIYPTDYQGQVCGMSDNVAEKPYLFFFDYLECLNEVKPPKFDCTTSLQVCVDECPKENYAIEARYSNELDDPNVDVDSIVWDDFICIYGINAKEEVSTNGSTIKDLLVENKCANFYTKSDVFTSRCYPEFLVSDTENDTTPNNRKITEEDRAVAYDLLNFLQKYERFNSTVEDLKATWPYMVAGITISMFASLLYIVLMRWIAAIMVWSSIVLVFALLGYGTYFCWNERNCIKNNDADCTSDTFSLDYEEVASYVKMERTWYIAAIIMSTMLAILTLIMLFLFKRIRIAIALIKEASRAVSSMLCSLLWPVIPFIMQLAFLTFWAFSVIFIASIVEPPYQIANSTDEYTDGASCEPTIPLNGTTECILIGYNIVPNYVYWFEAYNLVALFWILNFISALGEITLAGAFASYYWAFTKPDDIKNLPLLRSFWRSIRYHIGSIAFGSLIITIIQLIRVAIQYVEDQVSNAENFFTKFIFKCCKCCFWCLEKIMRFINRNAYIEIAVYGKNFCTSAKNAFFLLMRNIARATALNGISSFMLFVGKIVITLGTAFGASVFFRNYSSTSPIDVDSTGVPAMTYFWAPILFMALAAYIVANSFFGVYDMAIDTLFLCFLEDLERHDGTPEKPYYMSKQLMDILGVKNKKKKKGCCH